eukprot:TRINITY_DN20023_c0_g1_i1.p1 TRINITY_DN20023_c0_g1~~TRINITY_DN20023_c0_g1_i1.p1  ORF type:complete len:369 (+),score=72.18 TRINITY_DN20023_c0_g1_i1:55-1107(+)
MENGNAMDYVVKNDLSPQEKIRLVLDAALGINFLHMSDPPVLHQDIKAFNVLVDVYGRAKVSDFGLSKISRAQIAKTDDTSNLLGTIKSGNSAVPSGTLHFTAPELLQANAKSSVKTDVYAYGMFLFEILAETCPWEGESVLNVIMAISAGKKPEYNTPSGMEGYVRLMEKCWAPDPKDRPDSFAEIVADLKALLIDDGDDDVTDDISNTEETRDLMGTFRSSSGNYFDMTHQTIAFVEKSSGKILDAHGGDVASALIDKSLLAIIRFQNTESDAKGAESVRDFSGSFEKLLAVLKKNACLGVPLLVHLQTGPASSAPMCVTISEFRGYSTELGELLTATIIPRPVALPL